MPRQLTLKVLGDNPREVGPLEAEGLTSYQIGRDPACELVVNVQFVSRRHCRIFRENGRIWIEDSQSTDGTKVNGAPLTKPVVLKDGDTLTVGDATIRIGLTPHPTPQSAETQTRPVAAQTDATPEWTQTIVASTRIIEPLDIPGAIPLTADAVFIGRDPNCGCPIRNPMVSWLHACLTKKDQYWVLEDLQSANGTFVNGMRLTKPHHIAQGDVVAIGPIRFTFKNAQLIPRSSAGGLRISARGLSKQVKNRQDGKPLLLLNNIELTIEPREFVGLLGGSGCGKSTFMDTLNGRRPATAGAVTFDGLDLYEHFDALKSAIGYVPQDVIFHDNLPLADTLRYTARLRLPPDTTNEEIEANIDRVLHTVGLADRRATSIRDLSGGQKKRVSIAIELLSSPQVLFLDEVTSGLDLGTEQQMMKLFRTLADDGMTIVCITHHVDSLKMTDMVAYFVKGRLAFFGPPDLLREHFGIEEIREIYDAEKGASPEEWEKRFKASKAYSIFVNLRGNRDKLPGEMQHVATQQRSLPKGQFLRQCKVLTSRYVKLLQMEYRNVLLLVALAPVVAVMLCIAAGSITVVANPTTPQEFVAAGSKQNLLCFGASIIVLFLALFGSVREIVKEATIYRHERFINLQIVPYFLSKAIPLIALGWVQVLLVAIVLQLFGGIHAGGMLFQLLMLGTVSVLGTLMGLAISSAASTSDWAIICMIAVVIPEILFSGALVPAQGFSGVISKAMIGIYWSQRAMLGTLDDATRSAIPGHPAANQASISMLVLGGHIVVMAAAALVFLAAKDGHGLLLRLAATARAMLFRWRVPK